MQDEHGNNGTECPPPWTVGEVFIALFLVYTFWTQLAFYALQHSGFYLWFYSPDLIGADGTPLKTLSEAARKLVSNRMSLWVIVLAFPFQVATIPFVLNSTSGSRPERLGLTGRHFRRNILLGVGAALILVPLVLGLNLLVAKLWQLVPAGSIVEHPLTRMAQSHQLAPVETALLVLSAVVTAPVLEELVFRGLLLRWFVEYPLGSHLGMAAALAFALLACPSWLWAPHGHSATEILRAAVPALFVLVLVPGYALVWRRARSSSAPALFASSLLFAAAHSETWPTPIALFVLALGLGYLVLRSGSLVAPIVVHSLFNGTSCVLLFFFGG